MKKIGWGWRIVILYSAFVAFILFLVMKTLNEKVELVSVDYYAQELAFQKQINKQARAKLLPEQLTWNVSGRSVAIKFPSQFIGKEMTAKVLFYRPSDSSKDFEMSVVPDTTGNLLINSEKFVAGVYNIKINWSADGQEYYNEGNIKIK